MAAQALRTGGGGGGAEGHAWSPIACRHPGPGIRLVHTGYQCRAYRDARGAPEPRVYPEALVHTSWILYRLLSLLQC